MSRTRALLQLAWRDTRTARRRLVLYVSSISIGVAALVAIDSFSANVTRSVREQSRALLGADLSLASRQVFTPGADSLIDSLRRHGVTVARGTTFSSMTFSPRTQGTRLVQVRALDAGAPFYGHIETSPPGRWPMLQQGHNALVDPSLLATLDAHIGDSLALGYARFAIIGTLANVPGDVGVAAALGPRVYIRQADVASTGLLGFGSRADYEALLKMPPGVDPNPLATSLKSRLETWHMRSRTVQDTERSLTQGIEQMGRFLGIVGLIALLLGGIGVASAIHAYIRERIDSVAVLRCVGATGGQVVAIYLLEAAALGLIGAVIGVALGVAAQLVLPLVFGDFLPVDVGVRLEPKAILAGLAVGIAVSALFTLLPVLGVRRISPLEVLRRDSAGQAEPARRDPARFAVALALAAGVVVLAIARTGSVRNGVGMSIGVAAALLVLWLSAWATTRLARRSIRRGWPFVVRQGVANLFRPANQTRTVVLSLGFGAFLLGTLALVQGSVLRQLSLGGTAAQANVALFDIQQDQAPRLDSLLRASSVIPIRTEPIVPMRIASVKGVPARDWAKRHATWTVRREYRSSFRDTLVSSEKLVAGRWWRAGDSTGAPGVSLERDLASELGVAVGDSITWDVQGVLIPTRVTSLREVNWARFEPNFFAILQPRALTDAPKTFVVLAKIVDPGARGRVERAVVERFPNVSTLDLTTIQQAVQRVLDKVALAIRFMALFSLATGVVVLVSAIAASRRQRVREAVLLKTLGATRAQVGRIMLAEYTALGVLGAVAGLVLAVGGAWAILHFVFESPFKPTFLPLAALALILTVVTVAIGLTSGREGYRAPPLQALRESGA